MIRLELFLNPALHYFMRCLVMIVVACVLPWMAIQCGLMNAGALYFFNSPTWLAIIIGALPNGETTAGRLLQVVCMLYLFFAQFWLIGIVIIFFAFPLILMFASAADSLNTPSNLNDWGPK